MSDAITLPKELAQTIINYLQTRPYSEVYVLIGKILEEAKKQELKEKGEA